jgi:hypothetical protein
MSMTERTIRKRNPTNGAFIAERMKNVHRILISLFVSPYKVYPSRKILTDVAALKCLFIHQEEVIETDIDI